jgi:threonine dehydrogenase-like Zn-dependent dehydrogenase
MKLDMDYSFENPAVYLSGPGQASIKDSPLPNITDTHSVILKIAYVGVCGSDVHPKPILINKSFN